MSAFSFAFSGDDIEDDGGQAAPAPPVQATAPAAGGAFPVQGQPQLPPSRHDLDAMLARLPSKVAYSFLDVQLDDGSTLRLPRRELWDVKVQLMAEEEEGDGDGAAESGLGAHDVKTGIYEGGFKSWESSVDLVKVLAGPKRLPAEMLRESGMRAIELGCGTALPSLALFQWALQSRRQAQQTVSAGFPLSLALADYNPSVLQLVTLPNLLLTWAVQEADQEPALQDAFSPDGELDLTEEVKAAFTRCLASQRVELSFVSGGWSPDFVTLLYTPEEMNLLQNTQYHTLVLGAETIYSPFALNLFAETLLSILQREGAERPSQQANGLVGAKRHYFGVGGSLDDFVDKMRATGVTVEGLREETDGVRRGVVACRL